MGLSVVVQPEAEPVSLAEAKAHARILTDADDAYVGTLVKAARLHLEARANRSLAAQTLEYALDRFPCADEPIELPRPPLVAVESVKFLDGSGVLETLDPAAYRIVEGTPGLVAPTVGEGWPRALRGPASVRIRYVAGWGEDGPPEDAKLSILILTAHLYDRREPVAASAAVELPHHLESLVSAWDWRTR